MLFRKDYHFRGKHANAVKQLTSPIDREHKIFETNMAVYMLAPVVGFMYGRRADLDTTKVEGQVSETNILAEKMIKEDSHLEFVYRLIMLLDKEYEPELDKRINKAFRDCGKEGSEGDMERFDQYVRGGVEVLHEKIYQPSKLPEDYIHNLYELIAEVDERWYQTLAAEDIVDLCQSARG